MVLHLKYNFHTNKINFSWLKTFLKLFINDKSNFNHLKITLKHVSKTSGDLLSDLGKKKQYFAYDTGNRTLTNESVGSNLYGVLYFELEKKTN